MKLCPVVKQITHMNKMILECPYLPDTIEIRLYFTV